MRTNGGEDDECAPLNTSSCSGEMTGQTTLDVVACHTDYEENDESPDCTENDGARTTRDEPNIDSVDDHASSCSTKVPESECLSSLPVPSPPERLPPSERYKPRPFLNLVPARPSLTRASSTYDSRSTDDPERRSSKRVSFQQAATSLYTPPSTTTSSPVSPSASPQLPFRTIFTKPAPVSIPPGQYTPVASSSPVSPLSPPAGHQAYSCLVPTCDTSFDTVCDRDRHERQHDIGDPPYSQCPICHRLRSSSAPVEFGLRNMLIEHISRRH